MPSADAGSMKLYSFFRSSAAYRVRIALNLKGLRYETVAKHLRRNGGEHRQPDYRAINPQGLVPALEHEGDTLSQSLAIIEYLDALFPEPPLMPRAPRDAARSRSIALAIACDIHPLNNLRVLEYLRSTLDQTEDAVDRWYRHWIVEGLAGLEAQVSGTGNDGRHCVGDAVTLADICLVPQMFNARRFDCVLSPYPSLTAIAAHLESLEPFKLAAPEHQPDAAA